MTKKHKNIEIMSPVGSYESLMAAIQGGADSVYFGVEQLNMRSKSSKNFTLNDLKNIVKICTENGIKTYLTLNTVMYDQDLNLMKSIIDSAKKSGVSAIIASDMAVINYARSIDMEIHMSTQANVSNIEAVKFYSQFADVIVTARELSLNQVAAITKEIRKQNITGPSGELIKIEIFAHGALCMAISGKCYMSLDTMNSSANRGACLQVCRRSYTLSDTESGNQLEIDHEYIMSPKDLWTIHFLNKILDAGVNVLKLEGRARSPEYVKTVTQCYSEAVDSWYDNSYDEKKIDLWQKKLTTVFNRGFWDGYYLGQKLGEWNHRYGSRATKRKIYIGRVTNYFNKIKVVEITPDANEVLLNDELLITGPTTGVINLIVDQIRIDDKNATISQRSIPFSIKSNAKLRRSDKVYKIVNADQIIQQ